MTYVDTREFDGSDGADDGHVAVLVVDASGDHDVGGDDGGCADFGVQDGDKDEDDDHDDKDVDERGGGLCE